MLSNPHAMSATDIRCWIADSTEPASIDYLINVEATELVTARNKPPVTRSQRETQMVNAADIMLRYYSEGRILLTQRMSSRNPRRFDYIATKRKTNGKDAR